MATMEPAAAAAAAAAAATTSVVATETTRGFAQGLSRKGGAAEKGYRVEISVPPSPPPLPRDTPAQVEPSHRTEENRFSPLAADPCPAGPRPLVPARPEAAQVHFLPTESPVSPPPPISSPVPAYPDRLSPAPRMSASPTSPGVFSTTSGPRCSPSQHKNIDWKNYTTYKDYIDAKRLHTYGCRTIQERLDSLRAAATPGSAYSQQHNASLASTSSQRELASWRSKPRSVSVDRGGVNGGKVTPARTLLRSVSQEKLGGGTEAALRKWPRSSSEDALPLPSSSEVTRQRAKSCDYHGLRAVERADLENRLQLGEEAPASRPGAGPKALLHLNRTPPTASLGDQRRASGSSFSPLFTKGPAGSPSPTVRKDGVILRPSCLPVKNSATHTSPLSSLSSIKTADYIRYQRSNFVDSHPAGLQLQLRCRADSLNLDSRPEPGLAARTSSCSIGALSSSKLLVARHLQSAALSSSHTNGDVSSKARASAPICSNGTLGNAVEGRDATVVVLRRDKNAAAAHIRPPSYVQALNDSQRGVHRSPPPLIKAGSEDGAMCRVGRERQVRQKSDSLNLDGSLDSIPFIGEWHVQSDVPNSNTPLEPKFQIWTKSQANVDI